MHYLYDGGELEVQRSLQDAVLGGSNQYQSPLALTQGAHRPVLLRHLKNTDPTKLVSTAQAPEKNRPHKTGEYCSGTWTNTDPTKLVSTAQVPEKHRPHKTGEYCSGI